MPNRMTGAGPSTSQSSDHACFRQRVGPGQAWDATTRRGWVIAAWVLDGRAGDPERRITLRGRAGVISGSLCRVVRIRRPGCSCQHSYPQSTSLKRVTGRGLGAMKGAFGVSSARRPGACRREPTAIRRSLTRRRAAEPVALHPQPGRQARHLSTVFRQWRLI